MLIEEVVSFETPGKCSNWGKTSDMSQIFQTTENTDGFSCFFCGYSMIFNLNVTVGYKSEIEGLTTHISFNGTLTSQKELIMNAKHIYDTSISENLDNGQKFDLMIMREHRTNVLWNCILLFQITKLPYDFILPFEDMELKFKYDKVHRHLQIKDN
jgi:hypothetical protein